MLLEARGLANPVRHQSDKPTGQLRHPLYKLRKKGRGKSQDMACRQGAPAKPVILHAGKRQSAGDRGINTPQTPRDPIPQTTSSDRMLSEDEERLRQAARAASQRVLAGVR